MNKHTPRHRLIARVPAPKAEQSAKFGAWYAARFGVVLDPIEASARLHHLTELFLLLGGADWLQAKQQAKRQLQREKGDAADVRLPAGAPTETPDRR